MAEPIEAGERARRRVGPLGDPRHSGPRLVRSVRQGLCPDSGATELKLHRWAPLDVLGERGHRRAHRLHGGARVRALRSGSRRRAAFERLLDAGAAPVGLGARDTLRLEMGYALYGHELTLDINPLEAGLGWALEWDAPFRGRERSEGVKEEGPARKLFGVVVHRPGGAAPGLRGASPAMSQSGELTSGNFSPTLGTGIATRARPRGADPGDRPEVAIEAAGGASRAIS